MMTAATSKQAKSRTEIGLVLQGGGALGAYEYGAITALLELMETAVNDGRNVVLRAVAGVSIGAINAACIVGAENFANARQQLRQIWDDFTIAAPYLPELLSRDAALVSVPHFYGIRSDLLTIPSWKYLYDTHPLLQTLADRVDFKILNASRTAFVITAVDVETGALTRFANQSAATAGCIIEPRHILASGSLPPQFGWTEIPDSRGKMHCYWDGGIVDNTPLGDAIDAFSSDPEVRRLLVVMNVFPQQARLPRSFTEVNERIDQLRFGNRLRQDSSGALRVNDLISTIEQLAALVTEPLPPDLQNKIKQAKSVELIEIQLTTDKVSDGAYGFRDFSRDGIEKRRAAGRTIALDQLSSVFDNRHAA
jgi:NTE family protein